LVGGTGVEEGTGVGVGASLGLRVGKAVGEAASLVLLGTTAVIVATAGPVVSVGGGATAVL
jgi:hypothetical protein